MTRPERAITWKKRGRGCSDSQTRSLLGLELEMEMLCVLLHPMISVSENKAFFEAWERIIRLTVT
jgi:hypothetical protein